MDRARMAPSAFVEILAGRLSHRASRFRSLRSQNGTTPYGELDRAASARDGVIRLKELAEMAGVIPPHQVPP